jgi:hypothetical protein
MASLLKNVASQNITFCLISSTGGGASTTTSTGVITAFVTKDATQASAGGTFSALGHGQWNYAPTQAETNATDVGIFVTATACIPCNLDFHTDVVDANGFKSVNLVDIAGATVSSASAQLGVNVVNFGGTAVTGRDIGASVLLSSGTGTGQITLAAGAVTVGTNNDKTGYDISTTAQSSLADVILDRDMSLGADSGSSSVRTPRQALRVLRNKVDTSSGSSLVVYKEDDATTSWTAAIVTSTAAAPIVTLTPP